MRELKILNDATSALEGADVLDPVVDRVRGVVDSVVPDPVRDALHGVPVGHTVHPVAVLLPIGAWIGSAVLDVVPGTERAARILVGVGIAGVLPSVATGLADWSVLRADQSRVGLVHALSNTVATGLYAASFVQRSRGRQLSGRLFGLAGLAAVGLSGYLGGHLTYRMGASVEQLDYSVQTDESGRLESA
jgi:uncharacterized membrane protein